MIPTSVDVASVDMMEQNSLMAVASARSPPWAVYRVFYTSSAVHTSPDTGPKGE